jgi:uncharacterized protein (TIGR02996 family)
MPTNDPQAAALLQAIHDDPDSDQPRLVYGDWLGERGDSAGELITVQCALARLPQDAPERTKLTRRQNQLLKALAKQWGDGWKFTKGELEYTQRVKYSAYSDDEKLLFRFARGFIDHVDAHYNALKIRLDWIKDSAPLLTSLRVRTYRGQVPGQEAPALLDQLPPLRALAVGQCDDAVDLVRAVGSDERFASLRALSLEYGYAQRQREELELLAGSQVLAGLRELDLYRYALSADQARVLTGARFALRSLLLNDSELGAEGAKMLADSPACDGLEVLGLYNNGLEGEGVAALAGSSHLGRLTSLDLRSNRIGRNGAEALGTARGLPALRTLLLVGNSLDPQAVAALCGPGLTGVQELNLQHTRLTDEAIEALVAATDFCRGLRQLSLRSNKLTDASADRLAQCADLAGLVELNLNNNKGIGKAGLEALRASPHLAQATIYLGNKALKR